MSDDTPRKASARPRAIVPLLPYQEADVVSDARFSWCCWSRQIGKSFTKSLRRLLRGLARRRTQIFLSAGERQSRELMLKVRQHCQALDIAIRSTGHDFFRKTRFRQLSIELPNGVRIIGLPANAMTARGFTGDVLLDEFAMHRDDRAIWASVFPSVLRGGGELDVASTPKGPANMFAALRDHDGFARSVVTLDDAIAQGFDADAAEMRRCMNDDELYRQEFECAFLDEGSAFLTHARIAAVEDAGLVVNFDPSELARCGGDLYAGVDIGRHRDLTVMWVLERVGDLLMTRAVRTSVNEPFREQSEALHQLLVIRRVRRCAIDAGGLGMPLAEAAVEAFGETRVEAVMFTPTVKDRLATGLRLCVEARGVRIPADEAIRNDWHAVRRTVARSGPARYEAVRAGDGHADRFWAAALAIHAARVVELGPMEAVRGEPLRFARRGTW